MTKLTPLVLAAAMPLAFSNSVSAADYSDDIRKNDHKWAQLNLMYAEGEKPSIRDNKGHDYLELEFGGRSGALAMYGYLDIFNLTNDDSQDKTNGESKMFLKLQPRLSIDALTGKDLSFGPVKEVYFSTLFNIGGGGITGTRANDIQGEDDVDIDGDTNATFWGVGADVMVPWLGQTSMNLYSHYDANAKEWNGYQFSVNWFKPFYHFDNNSFIAYQGYIDYQFGMDASNDPAAFSNSTSHGGTMFNGFYWHSDRYSLGYGIKLYNDVYGVKNNGGFGHLESTGATHFFAAIYKF